MFTNIQCEVLKHDYPGLITSPGQRKSSEKQIDNPGLHLSRVLNKSLHPCRTPYFTHIYTCYSVSRSYVDSMFWDVELPQLAICALMHTISFRMFTALSYLCFHPQRKCSYVTAALLGIGASLECQSVNQSSALLHPTFAPVR